MGEAIQFIGLNELESQDQDKVKTLSSKYYEKISRMINNEASLIIHIKQYKKEGSKPKFSLHVRLVSPAKTFEAEKHDWDLSKAAHLVFKALETELEHHFHSK